ncbi:MAG: metallophosphoesterase [Sumerlaeia bacterium]
MSAQRPHPAVPSKKNLPFQASPFRRAAYDFVARVRFQTAGRHALRQGVHRALKGVSGGVGYAAFVEPRFIETTMLEIDVPNLAPCLDGYRIVHLTDIHHNVIAGRGFLARIVEKANALDGDLIAITGDFVTHNPARLPGCLDSLSLLSAPDGLLATRGNHDYGTGLDHMRMLCEDAGIRLLENEHVVIRPARCHLPGHGTHCPPDPDARLTIGGVGDMWEGTVRPHETFHGAPDFRQAPRLLLSHNPQTAEILPEHLGVALQLSGHTHGGQIRVFNKAIRLLSDGTDKYVSGLVRGPHTLVYISRGVGTSALHFRWNCRPEIALIVLRSPRM